MNRDQHDDSQGDELARAFADVERRQRRQRLEQAIERRRRELHSIHALMGARGRAVF